LICIFKAAFACLASMQMTLRPGAGSPARRVRKPLKKAPAA
jgi:hypothetical protein